MPRKITQAEFIEKAKIIHGDRYDYSLVNYKQSKEKIEIICKKHGKFFQSPNSHLNGNGCKKCGIEFNSDCHKISWDEDEVNILKECYPTTAIKVIVSTNKLNKTTSQIRRKANALGLKKSLQFKQNICINRNKTILGRDLTYELVKDIALKYNTRGEFQTKDCSAYQTARRAGYLSEICKHMASCTSGFSIPQLILKNILDGTLKTNSEYNTRKIISPYEIDIYYPKFNLAVEYNGKGWHTNNKFDDIKKRLFIEKNINYIYIIENNRSYENDIKSQLIENFEKINSICKSNITKDEIADYKIENPYSKVYSGQNLIRLAKSYNSFKEFISDHKPEYEKLKKLNLVNVATHHMSGKRRSKWNMEDLKLTINKYSILKDLIENDSGAYFYIMKHKLNHLISHLKSKKKGIY